MSNRLDATRSARRQISRDALRSPKEPKTYIRLRQNKQGQPWLEAVRRPGDGMWTLWYRADRMALDSDGYDAADRQHRHRQHVEGYEEETYTGWVQINVARKVKDLLDTAPKGYI